MNRPPRDPQASIKALVGTGCPTGMLRPICRASTRLARRFLVFTAFAGLGMLGPPALCGCGAAKPAPKSQSSGQSFSAAMQLVCFVDDHIQVTDPDDPLERDQQRSDFLQSQIKNPDVIYHRTLWRVQANLERSKTIRDLSSQAQLKTCPYADALADEDY